MVMLVRGLRRDHADITARGYLLRMVVAGRLYPGRAHEARGVSFGAPSGVG
jgi:hypothetical protein